MNLALMAISDYETPASSSQIPIFVSLDMSNSKYKQTVESLSVEIFNIHTSLTSVNEKIIIVTSVNEKL